MVEASEVLSRPEVAKALGEFVARAMHDFALISPGHGQRAKMGVVDTLVAGQNYQPATALFELIARELFPVEHSAPSNRREIKLLVGVCDGSGPMAKGMRIFVAPNGVRGILYGRNEAEWAEEWAEEFAFWLESQPEPKPTLKFHDVGELRWGNDHTAGKTANTSRRRELLDLPRRMQARRLGARRVLVR